MKLLYISLISLFGIGIGHAQKCQSTLSGIITDKDSGEPLISAQVKLKGEKSVSYTNFDGEYTLEKLCDQRVEIEVSEENSSSKTFTVLINGDTHQDFQLDHHHEKLEEVRVLAKSAVKKSATAQEQSISEEDIDNFSSGSLGDALKQMSGVSTLSTGKNIVKPVIQGLSSSRVPILNNGVRMEDQEWGADHAPNIDQNAAGKLTVIKGAAALQYGGDAIGGVTIMDKPDIPKKDTLYGKTILSGETNGRGGTGTTSLTKSFRSGWYMNVQGTYKKFGDNEAPDYILSNTGTNQRSFSLNAGLNQRHFGFDAYFSSFNNRLGILRASSTGSVSDLVKAINQDKPIYEHDFTYGLESPKQKVNHQLARLNTYYYFDGIGKLNLSYSYQENDRLEYDIRRGDKKFMPSVDLNLKTHAMAANMDFNTRNNYGLNVGIDGSRKSNFANPDTGVQRIIPDYKSFDFGAFAIGHYSLDQNWLLEAGLRYDYSRINAKKYYNKNRWIEQNYDEDYASILIDGDFGSQYLANPDFHYSNISATAGAKYHFNDSYELQLNYAMSNRGPNPSELFSDGLHHSSASLELGDLRLDSEHSHKVSLNFEKEGGQFTYTIAPYINYIDNFINTEPNGLEETVRGVFLRYEYQQQDVRLLGLDLDADFQFDKNFGYRGTFSTVDGRETKSGRALIDIPATNIANTITYRNHSWHKLTLSLRGEATFKKNHYPDDNFSIKVLNDGVYEDQLVDISTPPNGYFLTGFDASAVFHPYKHGAMHVRLSLDNIFNVSYRNYLNRLRYFADNTGRNISLQLKFTY